MSPFRFTFRPWGIDLVLLSCRWPQNAEEWPLQQGSRSSATREILTANPKANGTGVKTAMRNQELGIVILLSGSIFADPPPTSDQISALKKLGAGIKLDDKNRVIAVNLGERRITDSDLVHLKGLDHLQELDLTRTAVTSAGLVNLKGLNSLTRLFLTDTKVDDAGIGDLKGLKTLELLGLSGTKIGDAALDSLRALTGLKQLFCISTSVTKVGEEKLKKALPGCQIVH